MRTYPAVLALSLAMMVPAAAGQEATAWTPEQREQIDKLIKKAKVATQKTSPEQQAQMRANGQPVEMLRGEPKFTESKIEADVYGCVVVSYEILADGTTDEFEVVKASAPGVFDMLAMRVLMASEFERPAAASGPRPRHHKALLLLIPEPPPKKHSLMNERRMAEREARRNELRAKCEAQAP